VAFAKALLISGALMFLSENFGWGLLSEAGGASFGGAPATNQVADQHVAASFAGVSRFSDGVERSATGCGRS
jgi:hypothetical protein